MFKIGDKVVSKLNPPSHKFPYDGDGDIYPPVKKNHVYLVKGIMYCSHCGSQHLDLGLATPPYDCNGRYHCNECGGVATFTTHTWWLRGLDFEKVVYSNISAEIVERISLTQEKSDQPVRELSPKPETV